MKILSVGWSPNSSTICIDIGNVDFLLPLDPENDLAFDPRPIRYDRDGFVFSIQLEGTTLTVTRIDENRGWNVWIYFRVYDRSLEAIPPFDSSAPYYVYWGLDSERAPFDTTEAIVHPTVRRIKYEAFKHCRKMVKCVMGDRVKEIQRQAFYQCTAMKCIRLSRTLKKIGGEAFRECTSIDTFAIPNTLTHIGRLAFAYCVNVKVLKLPDSMNLDHVSNIQIMRGCRNLLAIIPAGVTPKQWLKSRYDDFPLHRVCYERDVTLARIQNCMEEHPDAVAQLDTLGMTALHIFVMVSVAIGSTCSNQNDTELFYTLYDANPGALFMPDVNGRTPLDCLWTGSQVISIVSIMQDLCIHRRRISSSVEEIGRGAHSYS